MNWGYKILFVYIAFVGGIMLMVFKSSTQKRDLVTADYYAKELKYQERIDAKKRTQALSEPVKMEIISEQLVISFPKEFSGKKIDGTALFYCPSDNGNDKEQSFSTAAGTVTVPMPKKNKAAYELQLGWQADGNSYYIQNKLAIK
jgi:hypothetical protein